MNKKYLTIIFILANIFIAHSRENNKIWSLFDNKLKIAIPETWKRESFKIDKIVTEEFRNADKSINISLSLENAEGITYKNYLKDRYDAARINVWKESKIDILFKTVYYYEFKFYDYNKDGKFKSKFKKFVICFEGKTRYITVTIVMTDEALEKKINIIHNIISSIKIAE